MSFKQAFLKFIFRVFGRRSINPSPKESGAGESSLADIKIQQRFLKALSENEDDATTRIVFADWLDQRGEHDEADRQRKWPAAKAWLQKFCRMYNEADSCPGEVHDFNFERLIELGRNAVAECHEIERRAAEDEDGVDEKLMINCFDNLEMCSGLRNCTNLFWLNWSIITGVPLPEGIAKKCEFFCGC